MKIIVLDRSQNRDWSRMLNGFELYSEIRDLEPANIKTRDLLIVHISDFKNNNGKVREELKNFIKDKNCYVLFIAGNALKPINNTQFPRLFRRRTPVHTHEVDSQFGFCLKRLLNHLKDVPEKPDWSLIEPDPYPESLVTLYLLDMLTPEFKERYGQNTDKIKRINEIQKKLMVKAREEFTGNIDDNKWNDPQARMRATEKLFQEYFTP